MLPLNKALQKDQGTPLLLVQWSLILLLAVKILPWQDYVITDARSHDCSPWLEMTSIALLLTSELIN